MTPFIEKRLAQERQVIRKLLQVARAHNFYLSRVWDGEENEHPTNDDEALDVVFSVDECLMVFRHVDAHASKGHTAYIVLGNSGPEVIADSSVGEGWDEVMAEMNEYTDKMEAANQT